MATVSFIGLGNMGGPMAANLLRAGHSVRGFDPSAAAASKLTALGGTTCQSAFEAVTDANVVITMLPAGPQVEAVYLGDNGVISRSPQGTLFIDCSTIDVATSRKVAVAADLAGMAMVDAPVSGGTAGALAATLTFMVGGPETAFEKAKPYLEQMGKTIVHAGAAGTGQAAKICNNMILGISMIGVSEAFVLAEKLGLSRQKLFDIASKASGQCWSLTSYCPVPGPLPSSPANRGYEPGFSAAMMLKDLKLAQEAASSTGAVTPLGAAAAQTYGLLSRAGKGDLDFSAIIGMLRGHNDDWKN